MVNTLIVKKSQNIKSVRLSPFMADVTVFEKANLSNFKITGV